MRAWNGKAFDAPILSTKGPLNGMAVHAEGHESWSSPTAAWAHRSVDGKRFKKIDLESDADIETIAWTKLGLVAAGDDGTLLLSKDDGITFEPIETDSSDHFWAIVPSGNGAFLSGEERLRSLVSRGRRRDVEWTAGSLRERRRSHTARGRAPP